MKYEVWYTKKYDDEFEGADAKEFTNIKDAWNYFSQYRQR